MTQKVNCTECYLVDLSYRNELGTLTRKENELVIVYLEEGQLPNTGHDMARCKVEAQYPDCTIYSISLCSF